jgi:hypothetical protein
MISCRGTTGSSQALLKNPSGGKHQAVLVVIRAKGMIIHIRVRTGYVRAPAVRTKAHGTHAGATSQQRHHDSKKDVFHFISPVILLDKTSATPKKLFSI